MWIHRNLALAIHFDCNKITYINLQASFEFKHNVSFRFSFAADLWIMEDGIADGHVLVFDMKGIVFAHLAKLGIIHMKKYLFYLQVKV